MSRKATTHTQPGSSVHSFDAMFPGKTTVITTSASNQRLTVGSGTTIFRIVCTQAVLLAVGTGGSTPDATVAAQATYVPANTPQQFAVDPGQQVSVIQSGSSGTCYITEGL